MYNNQKYPCLFERVQSVFFLWDHLYYLAQLRSTDMLNMSQSELEHAMFQSI